MQFLLMRIKARYVTCSIQTGLSRNNEKHALPKPKQLPRMFQKVVITINKQLILLGQAQARRSNTCQSLLMIMVMEMKIKIAGMSISIKICTSGMKQAPAWHWLISTFSNTPETKSS